MPLENDPTSAIQAAIPVATRVEIYAVDALPAMGKGSPATDAYIAVDLYSNGDCGRTVITRHKMSDGIEAIVAEHLAARAPKTQEKRRRIAERVYQQLFTGR